MLYDVNDNEPGDLEQRGGRRVEGGGTFINNQFTTTNAILTYHLNVQQYYHYDRLSSSSPGVSQPQAEPPLQRIPRHQTASTQR